MTKYELNYIKYAKTISNMSDFPRVKIGCVLVKGHSIIRSGYNSGTKKSPLQAAIDTKYFNCDCTGKLHAETMALLPYIKQKQNLSGATLYTCRIKGNGEYGMARPCPRCMQLIKKVGIKKIVYTTDDGVAKEKLIY